MAVKKGKSSDIIYDYFKVDPIVLNGRFARYADAMWAQGKIEDKSRFWRLVDLYAADDLSMSRLKQG